MRDAEVEGATQNGPLCVDGTVETEVVPETQGHRGELQPAPSDSLVLDGLVTIGVREIGHASSLEPAGSAEWPGVMGCCP